MILTFERNNFAGWIHDGRVGGDWTPGRVADIVHVDNDHLCGVIDLFTHANEFVRLHGESAERNRIDIDADICEL